MKIKIKLTPLSLIAVVILLVGIFTVFSPKLTSTSYQSTASTSGVYYCGIPGNPSKGAIQTSIDFGCHGTKCPNAGNGYCQPISPITDLLFSIIRFLSIGVGVVIVASMVYAGIQYVTSRGEPQATQHAMNRIRANIIAVVLFIFAYAILSYVTPPGYFL